MKRRVVGIVICLCIVSVYLLKGPIPIPLDNPSKSVCDRMTTKALFMTVLKDTRTTNLAYIDPWPVFLDRVSQKNYPLRVLRERSDAEAVISKYIQETEGKENFILDHLKAECLLEYVKTN